MKPVRVYCPSCQWKGRRIPRSCECDSAPFACGCVLGHCPKCPGAVMLHRPTIDIIRAGKSKLQNVRYF